MSFAVFAGEQLSDYEAKHSCHAYLLNQCCFAYFDTLSQSWDLSESTQLSTIQSHLAVYNFRSLCYLSPSILHRSPKQTTPKRTLHRFTPAIQQNNQTLPHTAKMSRIKGPDYPGHRLNSREEVTDNSHKVPVHYTWTCTECGFSENAMQEFRCGSCRYGRGNGSVATGSNSSIKWKVTKCDYEGNEHWERRDRKRMSY